MDELDDLRKILEQTRAFHTSPEQETALNERDMGIMLRNPNTEIVENGREGEGFYIVVQNDGLKFRHARQENWWNNLVSNKPRA